MSRAKSRLAGSTPEPSGLRSPGAWLRNQLGGAAAYPVLALAGLNLFDELDQAAYGLFGPEIIRDFKISPAVFGAAFLPVIILAMFLPVLVGYVTDRWNRVTVSITGAIMWCGAALATGIVPAFWLLVMVRMLTGVGRAVSGPTHSSLLSDYYPVSGRGAAFSLHQNANSVGNLIGLFAGGAIAASLGWRPSFLILPLPGILMILLMLRLREPQRGTHEFGSLKPDEALALQEVSPLPMRQSLRLLGNIRSWKRYAVVWLFLAIGAAMFGVFTFFLEATFGVGVLGRGVILGGVALLGVGGATVGGVIGQRLLAAGKAKQAGDLLGWATVISALAFVGVALAPNLGVAVAILLLTTPLRAVAAVPVQLILSATVPVRIRGQGFGAIWFFFALGFFFLPIALGLGDSYSFRVSILLAAPATLVGAIVAFSASKYLQDDMDRANKVGTAELSVRRRKAAGDRIDLLEVVDLDVAYDNVQVLFNVDMRVAEGEMVALLGTNGAGKSTLLKTVSGLVKPSRGIVLYEGQDITGLDAEATTARGVILVPGGRGVFPGLSVRRNLRLGTYLFRKDRAYGDDAMGRALDLFPRLGERLDQPAGTLSGGEQQMVTLAQAFMAKPRILMIDELSLGLAPVIVEELLETVQRINKEGVTIILVEQSVNIALELAQRAYFMEKGEIRFEGPSAKLLKRGDIVRSVFLAGAGRGSGPGS